METVVYVMERSPTWKPIDLTEWAKMAAQEAQQARADAKREARFRNAPSEAQLRDAAASRKAIRARWKAAKKFKAGARGKK